MLETANICTLSPNPKNRYNFDNERQTYKYVEKTLKFRKSFKLFSTVLRGIPDYIVSEIDHDLLRPGFYEIKFENRKLSAVQVKLAKELVKVANVYIVRVFRNGMIRVEKVQGSEREQKDSYDTRGGRV